MTDEATAVVLPQPRSGDGIFDGRRAALVEEQKKRELEKRSGDALGLLNMTGGATNNQQIEEAVAGLDMEKIKQSLLDDFIAKLKGQLMDNSRREDDLKKRRDLDDSCPQQPSLKPTSNTKQRRKFQATVEDEADDVSHPEKAGLVKDARPQLRVSTNDPVSQQPSPPSSVISSGSSNSSATDSQVSPNSEGVMSPGGTRPRPKVRFSDRPAPVVTNARSNETSPKQPSQTMVRVNSLSSQSSPRQSAESIMRNTRSSESSPRQSVQSMVQTNSRSGQSPPQPLPPIVVRTATPSERPIESVWSAVDLKWGRLFTDKDEPTPRLHQVLRGLAKYLIAEYSPRDSLVIPPEKLYTFYNKYSLDSEAIDFSRMFDYRSTRALNSLARLYETLECDYHLIQEKPGSAPDVPALTPSGFARWITTLIQVFPDREADRLASVVADLPFEAEGLAVDGRPERVPRQLSRHLLPVKQVYKQYMALADAVVVWKRNMGLSSEAPTTSPSLKPASTRTTGGTQGRGVVELEVPRPRGEKTYRDRDRRGSTSRDDGSRRYTRQGPSSRHHHRQEEPLAPPPMGRHAPPPRSPVADPRQRREMSRTMSAGDANYAVSSGRPAEVMDLQRRTREEEYRAAQGRDRWGSLDSSTPRGASSAVGSPVAATAAAAAAASRRRSLILAASQSEGNPTYEEYLAAENGGGYDM